MIVDTYEKIVEIKRKREEMATLGVPEDRLGEIDAHANGVMAEQLTALAAQLVAESQAELDEGRRHELEIEVKWSLNRIANRIDSGYSIDIRTPELPPEADGRGRRAGASEDEALVASNPWISLGTRQGP